MDLNLIQWGSLCLRFNSSRFLAAALVPSQSWMGHEDSEWHLLLNGRLCRIQGYLCVLRQKDSHRYIAAIRRSYNLDSTNRLGSQ